MDNTGVGITVLLVGFLSGVTSDGEFVTVLCNNDHYTVIDVIALSLSYIYILLFQTSTTGENIFCK